jgi:TorA maturation chaperone TorD
VLVLNKTGIDQLQEPDRFGTQPLALEETWRSGTYSLLGRLLTAAPDAALLEQLASIEVDELDAEGLQGAWAELSRRAHDSDPQPLVNEYNALFIGLGRGELVPYASWYRTGFLMERPLAEVRAALQQLGVERQDQVSEPEDHIAVLCETMAMLIADSDFSLSRERAFFSDHLAPWGQRFFADLETAKTARFYRSVGRLGVQFMDIELRCLSMDA